MKGEQCFSCVDAAMFQYHGMTDKYKPAKLQQDYADNLTDGKVVDCISCGMKVTYIKTGDNRWKEERE
jgi:hypothetical protein